MIIFTNAGIPILLPADLGTPPCTFGPQRDKQMRHKPKRKQPIGRQKPRRPR
jgi:hypothetical protein